MVPMIFFFLNLFVQIVGTACDSPPAEANVWNVTDFSRWGSVGRGQLHTNCPFVEIQAFGGVYSIVQVVIPDAGAGTPRQQRKHPVTNTHLFCGLLLAPYNDFIKYGCNHCHYFEMPTS